MTDHISKEDLKRFFDGTMQADELLAADDHLAECGECSGTSSAFSDSRSISIEETHLTYAQLERYADEPDDIVRELVDSHASECRECKEELDGILAMRALVAEDLATPRASGGWFANLLETFSLTRLASAGAAALLFGGAFWLITDPRQPVADEVPPVEPMIIPALRTVPTPAAVPGTIAENHDKDDAINANSSEIPDGLRAEADRARASGRLAVPDELRELGSRGGILMSGTSESVPFGLIGPVGRIVETVRPTFRWHPLTGAEAYVVEVYDENFNLVTASTPDAATRWTPSKPLARGRTYVWQVTAVRDGAKIKSPVRPAPDARLKILDANRSGELAWLRARFPSEHVLLAVKLAQAGLVEEARRELRKELARNPRSARQVRKMLRSLPR